MKIKQQFSLPCYTLADQMIIGKLNLIGKRRITQTVVKEVEEGTNYAMRERGIGGDATVRHI